MTCKHCNEPIVKNPVTRSLEPWVYREWKHAGTNLIACFDSKGEPTGAIAEPKESE
jgi:hypothetical protein